MPLDYGLCQPARARITLVRSSLQVRSSFWTVTRAPRHSEFGDSFKLHSGWHLTFLAHAAKMKEHFLEGYKTLRFRCRRLLVDVFVAAGIPVSSGLGHSMPPVSWTQQVGLTCSTPG